jgi:chromate reductase, NAD(P)H dehydrogenase (quinone)
MKIIAVSGSLRRDSFNTRLVHLLVELAPTGITVEPATLHGIPLYDGDLEERKGIPEAVQKLRSMSPLWEMAQDGIDIKSIKWAAH